MKSIAGLEENKTEEAVKIQNNLRKKIKFWDGASEIRKWREEGLLDKMHYISKKDIKLPKRKQTAKKGDNGRVLIVGGSKEYTGAVALAGLAALRCGADWVTVAAPEKVAWAVNALSADLVTVKLKGDYFSSKHVDEVGELARKHDVVLIGNG